MKSRFWSPGLRRRLRWAALFSPTSGSRDVVETREGISRGACERLNLHRAASAGPAASFNLGLSDSNHFFGSAFDINFVDNQLGHVPAFCGRRGSTRELVASANAVGAFWGGHFGTQDGMVFTTDFRGCNKR